MRRFHREFGLKKARILRERLIPVSKGLKIGINRHPLSKLLFQLKSSCIQLVILSFLLQKLLVGTPFYDSSVIQNNDYV